MTNERKRAFRHIEARVDDCGETYLTRLETVYSTGRVEWSIVGTECGDRIKTSGVRSFPSPLDLDTVTQYRRENGWVEL